MEVLGNIETSDEIIAGLVKDYLHIGETVSEMHCNPPTIPDCLKSSIDNINEEMNGLMAGVDTLKTGINTRLLEIANLLNDASGKLYNSDHKSDKDIWGKIGDGLSKLLNLFIPSAKADVKDITFNGNLCEMSRDVLELLELIPGDSNILSYKIDGVTYRYDLGSGIFEYTKGEEKNKFIVYIPVGLADCVNQPFTESEKADLRNEVGRMDTIFVLTGIGEKSIEYDSEGKKVYPLTGIAAVKQTREAFFVIPIKNEGGDYSKMYDDIAAFNKMFCYVKGGPDNCTGKSILYGFSVGGHAAGDIINMYPSEFDSAYIVDSHPTKKLVDSESNISIAFINTSSYKAHVDYWNDYNPPKNVTYERLNYGGGHSREVNQEVFENFLQHKKLKDWK